MNNDTNRSTPAAQPAPASTGREDEQRLREAQEEYDFCVRSNARFAIPARLAYAHRELQAARKAVAARELDVEAERREFEVWAKQEWPELPLKGADIAGAGWYYFDDVANDFWLCWCAARSAAQGTHPESAQVSPEQAGDARDAARYRHIKADNHRCADNTFCLFLDLDGNLLPVASADMDAEIDAAMLEAAPSPNNSPVGADKEPK